MLVVLYFGLGRRIKIVHQNIYSTSHTRISKMPESGHYSAYERLPGWKMRRNVTYNLSRRACQNTTVPLSTNEIPEVVIEVSSVSQ